MVSCLTYQEYVTIPNFYETQKHKRKNTENDKSAMIVGSSDILHLITDTIKEY